MTTLAALHREARRVLAEAGLTAPAPDARLLVEHVTGTSRLDALRAPDMDVPAPAEAALREALARRAAGEPVHRIIGRRDFYGLPLDLSPATLEPRPDTEALVDLALEALRPVAAARGTARILDLGTGTGAVALALLAAEPRATALATDISADALATAHGNAARLGFGGRFETALGSWFEAVCGLHDGIVSNPPYIRSKDIGGLQREVREHDPRAALDGGADGLDAYRAIAAGAARHLTEEGFVAVEIGYDQYRDVNRIFAGRGFRLRTERRDLSGHVRALLFRRG